MTTIISNGYFLVADHRVTRFVPVKEKPTTIDLNTGQSPKERVDDTFTKINLLKPGEIITKSGTYIEAFAMAGNSLASGQLLELVKLQKGRPIELLDLVELLTVTPFVKDSSVVAVTAKRETIRVEIGSAGKLESFLFEPGDVATSGSGSTIADFAAANIKMDGSITMGDLLLFSAAGDPNTSPSYSVYGTEDKVLYQIVSPQYSEFRKSYQRVLGAMRAHNCPNYRPVTNCIV